MLPHSSKVIGQVEFSEDASPQHLEHLWRSCIPSESAISKCCLDMFLIFTPLGFSSHYTLHTCSKAIKTPNMSRQFESIFLDPERLTLRRLESLVFGVIQLTSTCGSVAVQLGPRACCLVSGLLAFTGSKTARLKVATPPATRTQPRSSARWESMVTGMRILMMLRWLCIVNIYIYMRLLVSSLSLLPLSLSVSSLCSIKIVI